MMASARHDDGAKPGSAAISNRLGARRAAVAIAIFVSLAAALFVVDPADLYLWIKALHVIAVISWMAGMLYLPRLFINHMEAPVGSHMDLTFQGMERRLVRIIMNPAMMIAWVAGLWLGWSGGHFGEPWFWVKFAGVVALSAAHAWFAGAVRQFAEGRNTKTARHWRMINEVPTLLMVLIVVMVIVKPF
jgi:protoporphyrinogen IX oxidase